MNNTISEFARKKIIEGLLLCTEDQVLIFKRMYSHKNLDIDVYTMVRLIPDEKLDWALTQVERTIKKNNDKIINGKI